MAVAFRMRRLLGRRFSRAPSHDAAGAEPGALGSPVKEGAVDVAEMKPYDALRNYPGCSPYPFSRDTVSSASLRRAAAVEGLEPMVRRARHRLSHRTRPHIADCDDRCRSTGGPRSETPMPRDGRMETADAISNRNATAVDPSPRLSLGGPDARRTPGWWFRRRRATLDERHSRHTL